MHEYEIRFLRADRSTDMILEMMHLNDNAAIRAARKLAEARPFEVWRGLDCIWGTQKSQPAAPQPPKPPNRPAA